MIIGYLSSSATTAKLVDLECTPKIRLQNFLCNFLPSEIILKSLFLNISILANLPSKWTFHTSAQHNSMGEPKAEKSTFTGTVSKLENFLNMLW